MRQVQFKYDLKDIFMLWLTVLVAGNVWVSTFHSLSPGRNRMIAVRTTDLVELTWEQEASVAVKQAELFSAVQQIFQYLLNNQAVWEFYASSMPKLYPEDPRKNLCFLIKSVIYYFL